jgi:hypothetical protein
MAKPRYDATAHIRAHLFEAADEGALFLRRILRGEVEPTKDNMQLATHARGALGAFTRYEATLSARDQTSVVVSKLLAGENADDFQRYITASLPDHPAIRNIELRLVVGDDVSGE